MWAWRVTMAYACSISPERVPVHREGRTEIRFIIWGPGVNRRH